MGRNISTKVYLVRVRPPVTQTGGDILLYAVMAKSQSEAASVTIARMPQGWRAFAVIEDGAPDHTIARLALQIHEPKQFA